MTGRAGGQDGTTEPDRPITAARPAAVGHRAAPRRRGGGNLIRKLRIAAGLTQAELVARLDPPISVTTLSQRERCDIGDLRRGDYDDLIAAIAASIP